MQEDEEQEVPSHLTEHNYNVPRDKAPDQTESSRTERGSEEESFKEREDQLIKEIKEEEMLILNETSLLYEAYQIDYDNSYYDDESPVKKQVLQTKDSAQRFVIESIQETEQEQLPDVAEMVQISSTPLKSPFFPASQQNTNNSELLVTFELNAENGQTEDEN